MTTEIKNEQINDDYYMQYSNICCEEPNLELESYLTEMKGW